jgi:NADPH-dependent 2,4-dienoyl-CoA reductase/sulfur reductase-like enzyme
MDFEEGIAAAKAIEESGLVDYMSVNIGHIETDYALSQHIRAMWSPLAPWLPAVAEFRKHVGLPLVHACRIPDLATARYAVQEGILDLVGMTRAHIADPHIVRKLESGREDRIRPCVGAGYCLDRIYGEGEALCIHNVATGREATMPHVIPRSEGPVKKVTVIGGGPAGLEAARVSAERGHEVTLHEASGDLGGQILLASKAAWRKDLIGIIDWYRAELERLGVTIRWNSYAEAEPVAADRPDVIVVATGGLPDAYFAEGGEHCISIWDALTGGDLSGSILIYDDHGQHQGPSCADHLSDAAGANVELVTPDRHAATEMGTLNGPIYMQNFYRKGVIVTPDHRLESVAREGNKLKAVFTNEFGGPALERVVDHVIVEHGTLPNDELFKSLRAGSSNDGVTHYEALIAGEPQIPGSDSDEGYQLFRVGDAVASRNIHAAIYDSLRLCKDL